MTRCFRGHPELEVEIDETGSPRRLCWRGRSEPVEVANRWRISEAWWGDPIERDYFKVVGPRWLALIYLDRRTGAWYLERLYD